MPSSVQYWSVVAVNVFVVGVVCCHVKPVPLINLTRPVDMKRRVISGSILVWVKVAVTVPRFSEKVCRRGGISLIGAVCADSGISNDKNKQSFFIIWHLGFLIGMVPELYINCIRLQCQMPSVWFGRDRFLCRMSHR